MRYTKVVTLEEAIRKSGLRDANTFQIRKSSYNLGSMGGNDLSIMAAVLTLDPLTPPLCGGNAGPIPSYMQIMLDNGFDVLSLPTGELIKTLGFDGKSIINPRQIEVVNEVFAPSQKDIDKALRIIAAIKEAQAKGSGVIAVNGKMVDRPVVIRAERTVALAIASGILNKEDVL